MKSNPKKTCDRIAWLLLLTPLLLATGCRKEQVQVYRLSESQNQPSEQTAMTSTGQPDASANPSAQMPSGIAASDVQNAPSMTWTTPAGWTQVPPSEMRVGSFKLAGANGKQADVSIVPLPGMAGGDFANVNRWRGQVGLQPAPDDQLQSTAAHVEVAGEPAQLYDIAGQSSAGGDSKRILAVIQHRDSTAWFYKMTGDSDWVEQQKPVFVDFLKSISFAVSQGQGELSPGHPDVGDMSGQSALPPGHPAIGDMNASAPAGPISHDGQPNWQVPADWQEVSGGQFLIAKFILSGDNGVTAAVNVSSSAGDGGGLPANVNRWRRQIGLAPEDEVAAKSFQVNGGQAQLVDFSGTNPQTGQPSEIVGVVVTQGDRTWFYKLMGDPKLVAAQHDVFTQFVQGVKY